MHDMRELIPPDAPKEVKIQLLARLHDQVMGEEIASRTHPSAALQLGVTSRVAANLKQVGGPRATAFSSDPTAGRSALIMSSAPVKADEASWREYSAFTGVHRDSVSTHV